MKTNRQDIWGEDIFVGDKIRIGIKPYAVRYGNFKYFGTERIGVFIESESTESTRNPPCDIMPLSQANSFIKIK